MTDGKEAYPSPSHFHSEFRYVMGKAPGGRERLLRLERALSDLRATRKEVTEVALDAEYGRLEGFSRAFRRSYGLSPSRYREQIQASETLPGMGEQPAPQRPCISRLLKA